MHHRHPKRGLLTSHQGTLCNAEGAATAVATHYALDSSDSTPLRSMPSSPINSASSSTASPKPPPTGCLGGCTPPASPLPAPAAPARSCDASALASGKTEPSDRTEMPEASATSPPAVDGGCSSLRLLRSGEPSPCGLCFHPAGSAAAPATPTADCACRCCNCCCACCSVPPPCSHAQLSPHPRWAPPPLPAGCCACCCVLLPCSHAQLSPQPCCTLVPLLAAGCCCSSGSLLLLLLLCSALLPKAPVVAAAALASWLPGGRYSTRSTSPFTLQRLADRMRASTTQPSRLPLPSGAWAGTSTCGAQGSKDGRHSAGVVQPQQGAPQQHTSQHSLPPHLFRVEIASRAAPPSPCCPRPPAHTSCCVPPGALRLPPCPPRSSAPHSPPGAGTPLRPRPPLQLSPPCCAASSLQRAAASCGRRACRACGGGPQQITRVEQECSQEGAAYTSKQTGRLAALLRATVWHTALTAGRTARCACAGSGTWPAATAWRRGRHRFHLGSLQALSMAGAGR